ncbi:MAG: hypothetical protein H8E36_03240 [Rhodospirillaceae bacterium]|nr:hypothetical protein [Rhodospirillaceae bacterium]MBL6942045.1 hypothetical protein [Rhodospirillales bacterium]
MIRHTEHPLSELSSRPNIVMIIPDQLAQLCAPSRFVMMSGRLPSKTAAWDNAVEFSSEVPTFAHYLAAEGYRTCLGG